MAHILGAKVLGPSWDEKHKTVPPKSTNHNIDLISNTEGGGINIKSCLSPKSPMIRPKTTSFVNKSKEKSSSFLTNNSFNNSITKPSTIKTTTKTVNTSKEDILNDKMSNVTVSSINPLITIIDSRRSSTNSDYSAPSSINVGTENHGLKETVVSKQNINKIISSSPTKIRIMTSTLQVFSKQNFINKNIKRSISTADTKSNNRLNQKTNLFPNIPLNNNSNNLIIPLYKRNNNKERK